MPGPQASFELDREVAAYVALWSGDDDPCPATGIAEQRRSYRRDCLTRRDPRYDHVERMDFTLGTSAVALAMRRYRPGRTATARALLYLHGGGWVLGDIDTHDDVVAELAARGRITAYSTAYRLAPEHPYPAALEDCWTALAHVAGLHPDGVILAGDSAGACLAAALCSRARRQESATIAGQLLIYPALGLDFSLPSYRENADAPLLSAAEMKGYWRCYAGGELPVADAEFAPLAACSLEGLPPSRLHAAELDPLRDDAVVYCRRLKAAGTPASLMVHAGLPHSFLRARGMSARAAAAMDEICADLVRLAAG